jgi:hypothetical protein
VIAALVGIFFYRHRTQALTEKDSILLADFVNTTSDAVFDGTLKQALAVQLEQSPYLNIFPQERNTQNTGTGVTTTRTMTGTVTSLELKPQRGRTYGSSGSGKDKAFLIF